jgi:hypothetical protein
MRPGSWFVSIMLVYFVVRCVRMKALLNSDFINFHLTDLLFVPAMCLFALMAVRWVKRDDSIVIKSWMVGVQIVFVSVYFEWYLPNYKSQIHPYTSDLADVLMYVFGGGIFLMIQRRLLKK